jgi:glutamate formiminotransferase/formiminotetrahydrofolate cyclodeaminase
MLDAGRYFLRKQGRSTGVHERELVRVAIESMGLEDVAEFDPDKKIVEYAIREPGSDQLAAMSLTAFNHELASDSPAPGGGSVAALAGALAASLAAMVSNLTHSKPEYEEAWDEMEEVGVEGQRLKARLLDAIDEDTRAFNAVIAAAKADPETAEQANQHATRVPYTVCEDALACFDLLDRVADRGNPNSVSDAGVGAHCAHAAVHGGALNVRINLPGVGDDAFRTEMAEGIKRMTAEADSRLQQTLEKVEAVLARQG